MNYLWWIYSKALEKSPKLVKVNTFLSILVLNDLVASIPSQHYQFLPKKASFCRWPKWTLMTLKQSSGKKPNFVKVNTFSALLAFKHLLASILTQQNLKFAGKKSYFSGGQNELTLMNLSRNIGKITKVRQIEHIFGNFCLQASTCIHSYPKKSIFAENCNILRVTKRNELRGLDRKMLEKSAKLVKVNTILATLAFKHLVASILTQR